jgi:hypothetical protein
MSLLVYEYKKNKIAILAIIILSVFVGFYIYHMQDRWNYREIMKDAVAKKMADKNPQPVFDGIHEPPLPTEDEIFNDPIGPDRNKNGIRDDVDIWINRSFDDYNLRMAYRQYSQMVDLIYKSVESNDLSQSNQLASDRYRAMSCIFFFHSIYFEKTKNDLFNKTHYILTSYRNLDKSKADNFAKSISEISSGGVMGKENLLCKFKIQNEHELVKIRNSN